MSLAPDFDDAARLPCLATGTPQAATMMEASVETFHVPELSPPVPTMSMAPSGAFTRSIFARMADTAPVISSTVSPRTRSAIRKPPICAGVTSPESRASNACSASARLKLPPEAIFAMIGLKESKLYSPSMRSRALWR
jgi:hypothetical protein